MLFAVICTDQPGALQTRLDTRPVHLDWLNGVADRVKMAGPFTSDDGEMMNGSLLIVEGESVTEVRSFVANDPYAKAGLFASVDVRPWRWTIDNTGKGAPK